MNGDLELDISPGTERGEYVVRVLRAPAGAAAPFGFQLDIDRLLEERYLLESLILASAVQARRTMPFEEREIQRIGQKLFTALFSREIYGTYRASLGAAHQSGHQLRVVLTLSAPELAPLPWEMLFDPETETYLCRTEPLVRRIPAPAYQLMPLQLDSPLRILGIVSSPKDFSPLNTSAEQRNLEHALAGAIQSGQIELVWVSAATWSNVHEVLLHGPWHVIHFIGHGHYDRRSDEGKIAMVDKEGNADSIEANRLVDLFSAAQPVPRLVVLNSCSSGESGASDLFSSTASALVRGGIHAVAAMQFAISDDGAIAFAQGFYTALANGRSVDEAARNGRIAIRGRAGGTLEWITPVLYVRPGSTQLFSISSRPSKEIDDRRTREKTPQKKTLEQMANIHAKYIQAHAELRIRNYGAAISLFDEVLEIDPKYRDAETRRDEAKRVNEPLVAYDKALEAEEAGNFGLAEQLFAVVLEKDPDFRDAAKRLRDCATKQRISDLEAEMRIHALLGRWQAVLDAHEELRDLDPAAADPEGLASQAAEEMLFKRAESVKALQKNPGFPEAAEPLLGGGKEQPVADLEPEPAAGHGAKPIDTSDPIVSNHGELDAAALWHRLGDDLHQYLNDRILIAGDLAAGRRSVAASSVEGPGLGGAGSIFRARIASTHHLEGAIEAICLSSDGALLATTAVRSTSIWDVANGKMLRHLKSPRERTSALVFGSGGQRLGTLSVDAARVFDTSSGESLVRVRAPRLSGVFRALSFLSDGEHFSTLDSNGSAVVWNIGTGKAVTKTQANHYATSGAFAADGTLVAIANGIRGTIEVMDILNNRRVLLVEGLRRRRNQGSSLAIALSHDATRLATSVEGSPPSVRDTSNGAVLLQLDTVEARSIVFGAGGRWLATTAADGSLAIWDASSGLQLFQASDVDVKAVAFSLDGTHCALGQDSQFSIWHLVPDTWA